MSIVFEIVENFDCPAENLFSLITDISRQPEWIEEVESITRLPERPLKVGASFEQVSRYYNRSITVMVEIVAFEAPRLIRLQSSGGMPTITTWRLTPEGSSTRLHFTFEGEPGDMYDMIAPGIEGAIKRGLQAQIQKLKVLLDA